MLYSKFLIFFRRDGPGFARTFSYSSLLACQQILKCLEPCTEEDLVIVLISGGGSALLPYPVPGLTLSQKQEVILRLTHAGADIEELNAVRSQLSLVKGGGLANYMYPAQASINSSKFLFFLSSCQRDFLILISLFNFKNLY